MSAFLIPKPIFFPLYEIPSGFLKEGVLCRGCLGRLTLPPSPEPCQLLGGRARGAAILGVFLVSAVVHEYIFCFVLGFFYPVMLLLFLVFGGELGLCMPL